jgi:hypothetical protein
MNRGKPAINFSFSFSFFARIGHDLQKKRRRETYAPILIPASSTNSTIRKPSSQE